MKSKGASCDGCASIFIRIYYNTIVTQTIFLHKILPYMCKTNIAPTNSINKCTKVQ